jgi:hypothetical protein
MQKDQSTGPDAPREPQWSVSFRTVPAIGSSFRINGRYSPLLSRILMPIGRIVIAWFEWRANRRARNESRPA